MYVCVYVCMCVCVCVFVYMCGCVGVTVMTVPNLILAQMGQLEVHREAGSGDAETREQLIKDHFTQRINDLTLQLQQADSKAVHFHAEVCDNIKQADFLAFVIIHLNVMG